MRLRSLFTLLILVWGIYASIELDKLIKVYRQVQWENSPRYILEKTLEQKQALRSAAYNKYDRFKLECLGFGSDMKLLKAMEAAGHTPEYQEELKINLYKRQHTLVERWFLFDSLLFSGASDHTTLIYYYKHLRPRDT